MHHQLADQLNAVVHDEVERLKVLTSSQVIHFPPWTEQKISVDDVAIVMTIWHDLLPSGEHRLVVQAAKKAMLGFAVYLSADGFAVSEASAVRGLTAEELASFR